MSSLQQSHIFISDVHLGSRSSQSEEKTERDLLSLIQYSIENKAALYILGDLLDYWMEYPHKNFVPPFADTVLDAFEEYNKAVQPAIFVTGNHDNWTFGHFKERGFDVEQEFRIITLGSQNILLMHGDGFYNGSPKLNRPFFHRILRNNSFISAYQKVFPPKYGLALMKIFSNFTRKRDIKDPVPLNKHAQTVLIRPEIDVVITGHDHIPRKETFKGGCYINLGTFFHDHSIAIYNNDTFNLVRWMASAKEFVPFSEPKAAE